jgi:hypothetical protein
MPSGTQAIRKESESSAAASGPPLGEHLEMIGERSDDPAAPSPE